LIKISKKVEYALIVLKHFIDSPSASLLTARNISDLYRIPFDTTAKVMQKMNNSNLLESIQGVNGGYRVCKDLNTVNYLQLTEIVEGKAINETCSDQNCQILDTCNISEPIQRLNQHIIYYFKGLSIEDLLNDGSILNLKNQVRT
jgi:Rrf2 family protein